MASPNALQNPRVVIIGAGFGGLSAAKRLAASHCRITLIDRHNYHLFQPLLYQVATAALDFAPTGKRTQLVQRAPASLTHGNLQPRVIFFQYCRFGGIYCRTRC